MAFKTYRKWEVVLVDLNHVKGSEMSKVRPGLIISPNVANQFLQTVTIAPLTSTIRIIPTRMVTQFNNRESEICFDQMKAVDKGRIIKLLGLLDPTERKQVNAILANMFSEL